MAKQEPIPNDKRCPNCEWSLVRLKPTNIWKCCNPDCKNTTEFKGGYQ
jgi:ribosomal protein L37AE/L43A